MRGFAKYFICFLCHCLFTQGFAQVNGTPEPCADGNQNTCQCDNAPILCTINDLDGFEYSMTTFLHPNDGPDPMCTGPEGTGTESHNPTWFSFFAWCEELTFEVSYVNCTNEGGFFFPCWGIQAAVYEDCSLTPQSAIACDTDGDGCDNNGTRVVEVNGMTIGSIYYFLVDGCCGSACDVQINIIGDCGVDEIPPWDQEIQGPELVCVGENVTHYLEDLQIGAVNYTWYVNGDEVGNGEGLLSSTNSFSSSGFYEICVDVDNEPCIEIDTDPEPLCITIEVLDTTADAGQIIANPLIACPGQNIELEVINFTIESDFEQWIIIVDEFNTIVVAEEASDSNISQPECVAYTVYSYNFYSSGGFLLPVIGQNFDLDISCSNNCFCILNEVTISWIDNELPVFDLVEDVTLDCLDAFNNMSPDLLWTDNCDGTGMVTGLDSGELSFCQGGTIIRSWEYVDYCGNIGTNSQSITLEPLAKTVWQHDLEDTIIIQCGEMIPPIIDLPYSNQLQGECLYNGAAPGEDSGVLEDCGDVVVRSWSYNPSNCQPTIEYSQYFILGDTLVPSFDTILVDTVLSCFSELSQLELTLQWVDNCDGFGSVSGVDSDTLKDCSSGSMIRTWTYQDACGNIGSVDQMITINSSVEFEWLDTLPQSELLVQCGDSIPSIDTLRYTNNASNSLCLIEGYVIGVDTGQISQCGDTLFRNWSLDEPICDSIIFYQQLIILIDTIPTEFINIPEDTLMISCIADLPTVYELEWFDQCDGQGFVLPIEVDTIDACTGGEITRTWEYSDNCNNIPTAHNQIIIVEEPSATACDDEDPCTINDTQIILCDGTICRPCSGIFSPTIDPSIEGEMTVCAGDSILLTSSDCLGSIIWYEDSNRTIKLGEGYSYNTGPLYENITVYFECDNDGCISNLIEVTVTVLTVDNPVIIGEAIICQGDSTNLQVDSNYDTYVWSTGQNSESIQAYSDGLYGVTVTNQEGCSDSTFFEVTVIDDITNIEILGSTSYCVGGFTELSIDSDFPNIEWSNNSADSSIIVMEEGWFSVTVSDSNGCTGTTSVMISEQQFLTPIIGGDLTFCEGATTELDGGTAFQSWEWSTGEDTQYITIDNGVSISLTVTDFSGCTGQTNVMTIVTPNPLPSIFPNNPTICVGGQVQLSLAEAYDNVVWSTNEMIDQIMVDQAITYGVTVTDANGCTGSSQVTVEQLSAPKLCEVNYTCNISDNSYSILFTTTGNSALSDEYSITPSDEGFYVNSIPLDSTVTLQLMESVSGCDTLIMITPPDCSCIAISDAGSTQEITCANNLAVLGSSLTSSGANFSYSWTDSNGVEIGIESTLEATIPGTYTLEVFDAQNMCSVTSQVTVLDGRDEPIAVILADPANVIDCLFDIITLTANQEENVTYSWQFNKFTSDQNQIEIDASGEAFLFAVDTISGCMDTTSLMIEDLGEYPFISILDPLPLTCDNTITTIDASSSQSSESINYQWYLNGEIIDGETELQLSITEPGAYALESMDSNNNCVNIDSVLVQELREFPEISLPENLILACDGSNSIILAGIISQGNVVIEWLTSNGEVFGNLNQEFVQALTAGEYTIEVTDEDTGCKTSRSIVVTEAEGPTSVDQTVIQPTCQNLFGGGIILSNIGGGTPPYTFSINNQEGPLSGLFNNLGSGEFIISIQDSLGCTLETNFTLVEPQDPTLEIEESYIELTVGDSTLVSLMTNVELDNIESIIWNPSVDLACENCLEVPLYNVTSSETYTITLTDLIGCVATTELELVVNQVDNVFIPNIIDAKSEAFYPLSGTEGVIVERMQVFDRWGNLVFSNTNFLTNDPSQGWSASFSGNKVEAGVYVYLISFDIPDFGKTVKSGDITVIY